MNIVEKYETVIAYLYPIAQNMPRTPMSAICSTIWRLTMASAVINTRKDLDAIAGTPQHDAFMAMLAGTLWRLVKDDAAQAWVAVEDNSTIERFNFNRADFPDAQPPALPKYFPSKSPEEIAASAAIKAKLLEIDLASIRGLREYIAAKPDAPQILKDKEAEAAVERDKFTNMKTKP